MAWTNARLPAGMGGGQDTHHEGPRGASMEASRLPVPSGCRGTSPAQLQLRGRGLGA